MKKLAWLLVLAASGCPDVKVDGDETGGPVVEFDPAKSQATGARFVPFPNDLIRDPMTGNIAMGAPGCPESPSAQATRESILNKLDGFGTYETGMSVTFTSEVDMASLDGNVVMYQMTNAGTAIDPASAVSVPIAMGKGKSYRFLKDHCDMPDVVNSVGIVPLIPLNQKSTYVVALLKGVKDVNGKDFTGSATWGLINAKEDPVTLDMAGNVVSDKTPLDPSNMDQLAQLLALDTLWKAHSKALTFLDSVPSARPRGDNLVAFQFTTQTTTDPLDPTVADSPASKLGTTGFLQNPSSQTGLFDQAGPGLGTAICTANGETDPTQCFLKLALGGCDPAGVGCGTPTANNPFFVKGATACQIFGCAAIADVQGTAFGQVNYQMQLPNSFSATSPLQGAWSDPVHPEQQGQLILKTLIVIPKGTPPTAGWPVVIYGHGLTLSKETALTFAGRAAQAGFVTVAFDFSGHGERATRTSKDAALGCTGRCVDHTTGDYFTTNISCESVLDCPRPDLGDTCGKSGFQTTSGDPEGAAPTPRNNPQCYDPFFSTDLAKDRDGLRQTVLDLERAVLAVKKCSTGCGTLTVDPTKIFYTGVSLGGILGSIATAESPTIKAAMLSVPGAGWLDLLENTDTVEFRCPLVDGLIDAGILTGKKWSLGTNADALCLAADKSAWMGQPGYGQFAATARWVLDPADPANFMSKLAPKRFMIQEVTGDHVVPNIATDRMAALLGMTSKQAAGDAINLAAPAPSAAVLNPTPLENKYIKYTDDASAVYEHASLIRPAPTTDTKGAAGTVRMQLDAATFLGANK